MKKTIILSLVIIFITTSLSSWMIFYARKRDESFKLKPEIIANIEAGIKITPPAGWITVEKTEFDVAMANAANYTFLGMLRQKTKLSLKDAAIFVTKQLQAQSLSMGKSFKVLDTKPLSINGVTWVKIHCATNDPAWMTIYIQVNKGDAQVFMGISSSMVTELKDKQYEEVIRTTVLSEPKKQLDLLEKE